MSGWQRIGVVISILWLVGLPIFLMIDTNRRANDFYSDCLGFAYRGITGNTPKQQTDAQIAECRDAHQRSIITPAKPLRF